jgi:type IV pilus assembly protein PilY1
MNIRIIMAALVLALVGLVPAPVQAQSCTSTSVTENFTGASTNCTWNYYGGACLTAGSKASTATSSPGQLPMCKNLPYYGSQTQVGGNTGDANQDTPLTGGALRLTNSADNQSGAIVSNVPFSLSSSGLSVTFTTETYIGDQGSNSFGGGSDGADGISFFLQDASKPVSLGDYGGSLGYTCSNTNNSANQGYDGMVGAYIGLGIDEYGNFLDGSWVTTPGTPATVVFNPSGQGASPQDNTATGYGKKANRVGLRGAGNVAWSYLSTNSATSQYYPLTLTADQRLKAVRQTCETGFLWDFSGVHPNDTAGNGTYLPTNHGSNAQTIDNPYSRAVITTIPVADYGAIPNAYAILSNKIAVEGATKRGYSTAATTGSSYGKPITYNLTVTTAGLLSLSYSFDGGLPQPVISGQDITAANGALPSQVRFGFAGSTGGSRNVHEIMCFQAQPQNSASSSAGLNQKQSAKVQTGTQVYFAFYNPNGWTGSLTSQNLDSPDGNPNDLQIDPVVNWDASCVLTGLAAGATCAKTGAPNVAPPDPDTGRTMLTSSGVTGIPFTWSATGSTLLSAGEQSNLNFGDPSPSTTTFPSNANMRLEYLRGVRTHEQSATGVDPAMTTPPNPSGFRQRTSVLGDIVDSSPTWVGPPSAPYPAVWTDLLNPTQTMPENSGQTYATFISSYQGRTNVVYAGANDGFMHGFRAGAFTNGTTYNGANNDGHEVLAYMPAFTVNAINSSVVPGSPPVVLNTHNDYTNPLYSHRFSVDGTPGTGELFYNGGWHTWLVGGLGAGGSAIFALDITNPDDTLKPNSFSQGNAAGIVIGEWSSSIQSTSTTNVLTGVVTTTVTGGTATFGCVSTTAGGALSGGAGCGNSLGKTFGTPQIRKFHNATGSGNPDTSWGAVFGNGSGSYNGDAGIFVMIANNTGQPTFYYLSTGVGSRTGTANGIYYVTPADLDGDHVTDYVYAGDLQGNVWRFDLTSSDPTKWAVTSTLGKAMTSTGAGTPIYSTGSTSIPITTKVVVASIASMGNPRVLVEFGTGRQTQFTNNVPTTYATTQQYLIGIWDWNLSSWNSLSNVDYASLSGGSAPSAISGGLSGNTVLQSQSVKNTYDTSDVLSSSSVQVGTAYFYETISNNTISWADTSTTSTKQFGWYLPLASGYGNPTDPNGLQASTTIPSAARIYEQVIFNPTLQDGAFLVNTTIPPTTLLALCSSTLAGGWTMAINPATGGAFTNSFFGNANHQFISIAGDSVSGVALSGTGSPSVVMAGTNTYLVTQTTSGNGAISQINPPAGSKGSRLTWIERR